MRKKKTGMFRRLPQTEITVVGASNFKNRGLPRRKKMLSLFSDVTTNLHCFELTVSVGRVSPLGADLAGLVTDNEGANGESLGLLVGAVVEARASGAGLVACVGVCVSQSDHGSLFLGIQMPCALTCKSRLALSLQKVRERQHEYTQ